MNIFINILILITEICIILKMTHMMQLNSYNIDQTFIWYKKNIKKFVFNIILCFVCIIFYINKINELIYICFILLILICLFNLPINQKKKIVFTKRAIRLITVQLILVIALFLINYKIYFVTNNQVSENYIFLINNFLIIGISPLTSLISFLTISPYEKYIRKKYISEAKNIINNFDKLDIIAITGSFAKTSTKYFMKDILKNNFNVCATKGSFNTEMGQTITIKNELKSIDNIYIGEFGARRKNDIKDLCDMVNPNIGVVVEVGNQHLDTFKNITNVLNTKFELVDSIIKKYNDKNNNKICIVLVNGDNDIIYKNVNDNYTKYFKDDKIIWTYGFDDRNDYKIEITKVDETGTEFLFKDEKKNEYLFNTHLLGKHNVFNLIAGIIIAFKFDMAYEDIKYAVSKINQVEHRLELTKINNETLFLDDGYNANVKGVEYAIDVLSKFVGYKKIVITPGIVELGDRQYEENKTFAEKLGKSADMIIIVGKTNKDALYDGIREVRNELENVIYKNTTKEAILFAFSINEKKIVLVENDLPDNY